jgi:hypothetical protein
MKRKAAGLGVHGARVDAKNCYLGLNQAEFVKSGGVTMKRTRKRVFAGVATTGLLLTVCAPAVHGDAPERFFGGSYDGYDYHVQIRSSTDWGTFPALVNARFQGGSYDGYDLAQRLNAKRPPSGTMIMIR